MKSQPENFFPYEKLLVALAGSAIDFAVVGGIAISLNGFVRATEDVDIIVADAPENLGKMLACLERWGEGWARELKVADFTVQEGCIRLVEDFCLDIFIKMNGKTLADFRPRLRYLETASVRIPYLAPADLIFLKEGSWREKDKFDVQAMREIMARENAQAGPK
jgi:hypothetical protein